MAADGNDALLVPLAGAADETALEVDVGLAEPHGLADSQPRAVEQLCERAVPERTWGRARRRLDQALCLRGRERAGQAPPPARELERRSRAVRADAEQDQV